VNTEIANNNKIQQGQKELDELTDKNYQLNERIRLAREEKDKLEDNNVIMEKHILEHNVEELQSKYKLLEDELKRMSDLYKQYNDPDYLIQRFSNSEPFVLFHFLKMLHNGILEKKKPQQ
jgi:hypothetical protein